LEKCNCYPVTCSTAFPFLKPYRSANPMKSISWRHRALWALRLNKPSILEIFIIGRSIFTFRWGMWLCSIGRDGYDRRQIKLLFLGK
jgi:hypothetical protein